MHILSAGFVVILVFLHWNAGAWIYLPYSNCFFKIIRFLMIGPYSNCFFFFIFYLLVRRSTQSFFVLPWQALTKQIANLAREKQLKKALEVFHLFERPDGNPFLSINPFLSTDCFVKDFCIFYACHIHFGSSAWRFEARRFGAERLHFLEPHQCACP